MRHAERRCRRCLRDARNAGLAAGLLFTQLRRDPTGPPAAHIPAQPPVLREAEQILAGRFARGEMDADEYEQRLRTLHAAPH